MAVDHIRGSISGTAKSEELACIAFCLIDPVFVGTRFWSRWTVRQIGADDWISLVAFFSALSGNIQILVAHQYGWGHHMTDLPAKDLEITLILHWTFQITYKLSIALNKASILLLFLRIMPQKFYRISCWALLALVSLFAVSTIIAGILQCIPVDKAWHKKKPGHCYPLVNAWYVNAIFSIITDCVILALPMRMVHQLQRDAREKMLLYMVFGVGIFVTITSILRMTALHVAKSPDTTYDVASGLWSIIEINVGVICICLPPLRALLARYFSFSHASTRSGSSHPSGGSSALRRREHYKLSGSTRTLGSASPGWGVDDARRRGRVGLGEGLTRSEEELFAMGAVGVGVGVGGRDGMGGVDVKRAIVRKTEMRFTTSVRETGGEEEVWDEEAGRGRGRTKVVEGEEERWRERREMGRERPQWYCRPEGRKV